MSKNKYTKDYEAAVFTWPVEGTKVVITYHDTREQAMQQAQEDEVLKKTERVRVRNRSGEVLYETPLERIRS